MQELCSNKYKTARQAAGLTQERWAEVLGISVESVRLYESGRGLPSDEVVAQMAEVAVMPVLAYWHIKNKSAVLTPQKGGSASETKPSGSRRCLSAFGRNTPVARTKPALSENGTG